MSNNLELRKTAADSPNEIDAALSIEPIDKNNLICITIDENIDVGFANTKSYYLSIQEAKQIVSYLNDQIT